MTRTLGSSTWTATHSVETRAPSARVAAGRTIVEVDIARFRMTGWTATPSMIEVFRSSVYLIQRETGQEGEVRRPNIFAMAWDRPADQGPVPTTAFRGGPK